MSPIKAKWLTDGSQRGMVEDHFDRGQCQKLVIKMSRSHEPFDERDKLAYEWLMENMQFLFKGTCCEKLVPAFKAILTSVWAGNKKVFFDLEILEKLRIGLAAYLTISQFTQVFGGPVASLARTFAVDKRG